MVTRLNLLRSKLARLRHVRSRIRASTIAATIVSALGASLLILFAIDVLFDLRAAERAIVIALAVAAAAWIIWRFCRPLFGIRESEIDVALAVERQEAIDSDLVAALEFERPQATAWGSPTLASAV